MSQKTDVELLAEKQVIKTETVAGANTALRNGTMLENIIDSKTNNTVIEILQTELDTHEGLTNNPHNVTKSQVGLGSVDNTADTGKPVSTAQQNALDLKANLASPTFTGTVGGVTKSMVGLGSADNTADSAKPVSTAQQAALDLKANITYVDSQIENTTIVPVTGAGTLSATAFNKVHFCTGTSADYTIVLPTAVGYAEKSILFKGSPALTKVITIDGNASETIGGKLTRKFSAYGAMLLMSDGANWIILQEIPSAIMFAPVISAGYGVSPPSSVLGWYSLAGNIMTLNFTCNAGTSNATTFIIDIPDGWLSSVQADFVVRIQNNNTFASGMAEVAAGGNTIALYATVTGGAFATSGNKAALFQITLKVQ